MTLSFAERTAIPERRLIVTLVLALIIHAALILGIRFNPLSDPHDEPVSSINVSLLKQAGSETTISSVESAPPLGKSTLSPAPLTPPQPEESPPVEEPSPARTTEPTEPVTAPPPPEKAMPPEPVEPSKPDRAPPARPSMSESQVSTAEKVHHKTPVQKPAPSTLSAIDIMNKGLKMARLSTPTGSPASKVREKYFDPQAKSTLEDYYVMNWVRKVEQVGTLNFPDEARRRNLSGSLILDVALRSDGSIRDITLIRSSGHKVLDDAARDIVELAAPYAPFPEGMRRQYDILHIKRTWQFLQNNRVQGN